MAFLFKNYMKVTTGKQFYKVFSVQPQQNLKTSSMIFNSHKENHVKTEHNDYLNAMKKKKEAPKITLLQNDNIIVTALEDAKNLAKRRSMHLVKVQDMDSKTQRPVFRLLTAAEMLQNELSNENKSRPAIEKTADSSSKKPEKFLNIGSRIGEHDLLARLKNISKWLKKQHEVRILLQATSQQDLGKCENICKTIEESVKSPQVIGKIVQKRVKGNAIKFTILPVTTKVNEQPNSNSNSQ